DGNADGGGDEVDGVDDQGEEDALDPEYREESGAEDHGADGLGGGGLEDIGAAAGAVADVVPDEVGADVRGLGVDAAAELGEERDERGSEAEADELVDDDGGVGGAAVREEEDADAEQRERDDDEAGDRTSAERGLESLVQRRAGAGSG